jgi:hypothetical protein
MIDGMLKSFTDIGKWIISGRKAIHRTLDFVLMFYSSQGQCQINTIPDPQSMSVLTDPRNPYHLVGLSQNHHSLGPFSLRQHRLEQAMHFLRKMCLHTLVLMGQTTLAWNLMTTMPLSSMKTTTSVACQVMGMISRARLLHVCQQGLI